MRESQTEATKLNNQDSTKQEKPTHSKDSKHLLRRFRNLSLAIGVALSGFPGIRPADASVQKPFPDFPLAHQPSESDKSNNSKSQEAADRLKFPEPEDEPLPYFARSSGLLPVEIRITQQGTLFYSDPESGGFTQIENVFRFHNQVFFLVPRISDNEPLLIGNLHLLPSIPSRAPEQVGVEVLTESQLLSQYAIRLQVSDDEASGATEVSFSFADRTIDEDGRVVAFEHIMLEHGDSSSDPDHVTHEFFSFSDNQLSITEVQSDGSRTTSQVPAVLLYPNSGPTGMIGFFDTRLGVVRYLYYESHSNQVRPMSIPDMHRFTGAVGVDFETNQLIFATEISNQIDWETADLSDLASQLNFVGEAMPDRLVPFEIPLFNYLSLLSNPTTTQREQITQIKAFLDRSVEQDDYTLTTGDSSYLLRVRKFGNTYMVLLVHNHPGDNDAVSAVGYNFDNINNFSLRNIRLSQNAENEAILSLDLSMNDSNTLPFAIIRHNFDNGTFSGYDSLSDQANDIGVEGQFSIGDSFGLVYHTPELGFFDPIIFTQEEGVVREHVFYNTSGELFTLDDQGQIQYQVLERASQNSPVFYIEESEGVAESGLYSHTGSNGQGNWTESFTLLPDQVRLPRELFILFNNYLDFAIPYDVLANYLILGVTQDGEVLTNYSDNFTQTVSFEDGSFVVRATNGSAFSIRLTPGPNGEYSLTVLSPTQPDQENPSEIFHLPNVSSLVSVGTYTYDESSNKYYDREFRLVEVVELLHGDYAVTFRHSAAEAGPEAILFSDVTGGEMNQDDQRQLEDIGFIVYSDGSAILADNPSQLAIELWNQIKDAESDMQVSFYTFPVYSDPGFTHQIEYVYFFDGRWFNNSGVPQGFVVERTPVDSALSLGLRIDDGVFDRSGYIHQPGSDIDLPISDN